MASASLPSSVNAFAVLRQQIDEKLSCASARDVPQLNRLLGELEAIAQKEHKGTSQPVPPHLPPRPTTFRPRLPDLPGSTEYFIAERQLFYEIGQLEDQLKNCPRRKRRLKLREQLRQIVESKERILEQARLRGAPEEIRQQYVAAQEARRLADVETQRWEEEKERLDQNYKSALRQWRANPRNQVYAIQLHCISRLRDAIDSLSSGRIAIPSVPITRVPWRMLPPPEPGDAGIGALLLQLKRVLPHLEIDEARLTFAYGLSPTHIYIGAGEFDGYLAFEFPATSRVLLECPTTGNAAYIFKEEWRTLSRLSKSELLEHHPRQVTRVVHAQERHWKHRIKSALGMV
jgi:hypothetical protein